MRVSPIVQALGVSTGGNTAGNTGTTLGTFVFQGGDNITLSQITGVSNSNTIIISGGAAGGGLTNVRISAGTTSNLLSALTFSNANNVSFGLDASTLTASIATSLSNIRVSAGTTSNLLSALTFSNANNVSFGLDASTLTGSVATSLTNVNVSAGTTSNNLSALVFSNSNSVSFGLDGSTITASIDAAGGGLTNIRVSAGTTSNLLSAITFSNSNGVTFGLNASTITASVNAGGGGGTLSRFDMIPYPEIAGGMVQSSQGTSWHFYPYVLPNPLSCSNVWIVKSVNVGTGTSSNSSGRQSYSYSHGITIWSRQDYGASSSNLTTVTTASLGISMSRSHTSNNNSVSMAWITDTTGGTSSFSTTSAGNNWSSFFTGNRMFAIPLVTSFSAGEYFIAHRHSSPTATVNSNLTLMSFSHLQERGESNFTIRMPAVTLLSRSNPLAGMGLGAATAVTTTTTMAGTIVSALTDISCLHAVFINLPHT